MWKVGQTVWCVLRGKSEVIRVDNEGVLVQFGTIYNQIRYDLQGRIGSNFNRSLFFSEPKVDALTVPPFIPSTKKGDKLMVVDREDEDVMFRVIVKREFIDYIECTNVVDGSNMEIYKEHHFVYKVGDPLY